MGHRDYDDAVLVTIPATTDAVQAALYYYAPRGWPVLALHSGTSAGGCTCGSPDCNSPGKHPRTAHGLRDATTNAETIRELWARWPDANLGIATGAVSGLVVLDMDPRHGGEDSLDELVRRIGPLPETPEVLTGGAGRHIYFAHPGSGQVIRNATTLGGLPGLDLRGDGGYVVAPPSVHGSGRRYEWESSSHPDDVTLAPFPSGLSNLVAARAARRQVSGSDAERIPEGERNATLTSLAGTMQRRGMSPAATKAALIAENAARCNPPLTEAEVCAIVESVARYTSAVSIPVPPWGVSSDERLAGLFSTARELSAEAPATAPYIVNGLLARGALTELAGKVKSSGKTTFALALVRAVTSGRLFAGLSTTRTGVVYLTEQGSSSLLPALHRAGLAGDPPSAVEN